MSDTGFPSDVEEFLAGPHVARLATNGPTVRPVWFLWEDGAFWWITGAYAKLPERLAADPEVALVIDTCDLATGSVWQVVVSGRAEVVAMDADRAVRKLVRYLGDDIDAWPERFRAVLSDPDARLARLTPRRPPRIIDQSFR
ncbi:pyridoxamine 5'-phosphate oxidase (plasmid) [Pseudonocardia sp. EC080610-09]|uniref:pyridoxamine 5'-phosphate oxidase family protein n=1 Tax=unclassified Pseudonocardia TaxID=2619320 RepID=UPI0007068FB4|nr:MULTISPECIES: pyridoxamine 5'-phosphate oxidase family protein [unclassified Pseudonocardia]ALL79852.1 pyridoxamine 5'-phosphate oxidase [Pseudonocardia sp. EC080610-09]ALL85769.1 pyridoxamine 5'-phosphate oxidase [Pseudonocardia sp. EC080619-01]